MLHSSVQDCIRVADQDETECWIKEMSALDKLVTYLPQLMKAEVNRCETCPPVHSAMIDNPAHTI